LSHTAQNAILLGLLVTVVNRTGSTIHSSLLVLTFVVPSALLGIFGGIAVDHLPKREVLLTTGLLRTALCLFFLRSSGGVIAIYTTNFAVAAITQFAGPAESASLPSLVPRHQLVAATASLNLEFIVSQVLGTVLLAPLLVKTVGLNPLLVLTAGAFFLASLLYARLPELDERREKQIETSPAKSGLSFRHLRDSAAQSWELLRSDNAVLGSAAIHTLMTTTVAVLVSVLPVFTRNVLRLPAEYSIPIFAPAAIGLFVSIRSVPWLSRRVPGANLAAAGFGVFIVLLVLLGFARELSLLLAHFNLFHLGSVFSAPAFICAVLAAPLGFTYGVVVVVARAVLYEFVPVELQGRVFAFQSVLASLASILPLVLAGVAAYWLGPRWVLLLVAFADAAIALQVMRSLRPRLAEKSL
jgi:MFS family permease